MDAESGLEGPPGKSLRDLGEGEEGSSAGIIGWITGLLVGPKGRGKRLPE